MENAIALDEFETNLNWKGANVMGWTHMVVGLVVLLVVNLILAVTDFPGENGAKFD